MRKLYAALVLALGSTGVAAADFGIGVSARSDDGWLYVPIDVSKSFRLEPSIRYAATDLTFTQGASEDSQDTDTWELGVGVFGLKQVTEAAHIYYGARLAYVDAKTITINSGPFLPARTETNQDGYRIGPTVGFEYVFAQHFSVGGEASYTFLDVEGESRVIYDDGFVGSVLESEQKSQGTQTRLIFRYMF